MHWFRELGNRLRMLFRRGQFDADLDEEMRLHRELREQEEIERGLSPKDAHYAAQRRFGNDLLLREQSRDLWGWNWLENLAQDVRYGVRMLARNPGFTTAAVVTLALGIGANTTIFSLADALLLRPFPVRDPGRLVSLLRQKEDQSDYYSSFSYPDYQTYSEQAHAVSSLAAYDSITVSMMLNGEASRIDGEIVSGNYFSVLGVEPALGRAFLPEEDQASGAHPVLVLSADFWREHFNADRGIVGKTVTVNGHGVTVIGVAPAGFRGLSVGSAPAFWVPLAMHDQALPSFTFEGKSLFYARGCDWLDFVGRLAPESTVAGAVAEAKALAKREAASYPEDRKGWTAVGASLTEMRLLPWNAGTTSLIGLLMAVVGLVLLIACANVAGLLLSRAAFRQMEISVRIGLGAGRGRLMRQLLTESLLLALLGGAGALLLAPLAIRLLTRVELPGVDMAALNLRVDWRVMSFAFVLAALTAVIFGFVPAWQTSKVNLAGTLKESSRTTGGSKIWLRQGLVVSQIALSLVLLVGGGLLIRTFQNLLGTTLGFNPRNVLLMSVDLGLQGYNAARARQFYTQLLERVEKAPGVRSASWAMLAPLGGMHGANDVILPGGPQRAEQTVNVDCNWVSPGFFSTLGIPLLAGRDFTLQDREGTPHVAIVSETTARRFWPDESPLGQHFRMGGQGNQPTVEVVGVAKDGMYGCGWCVRRDSVKPFMFFPFYQSFQKEGTLLVKGEAGTGSLAASVRRETHALDADLPVFGIKTLQQQYREGLLLQRLTAVIVGLLGGLALVLAAVGIFGLVSFSVGQRTHELGLRMALGAQRRDVLKLILRQGFVLTCAGVAVGMAGAVALTRLIRSQLYGVKPTDPLTLLLATAVLAAVAFLACYIPARRATKVDPIVALRYE